MSEGPPAAEARVLRRTRLRLALLAGGTTFVVLLVLGALLYTVLARQLAIDSEERLRRRAQVMLTIGPPPPLVFESRIGPLTVSSDAAAPGLVFGGPASGTIAFVVGPDQVARLGPGEAPEPAASQGPGRMIDTTTRLDIAPDPMGLAQARQGRESVTEMQLAGVPMRVLSMPVDVDDERLVVQVMADRTAELRTLGVMLTVLVVGGLAVVMAAIGFGWFFAGRALLPVREAMRRQREFSADASHELRTPLSILHSDLEVVRSHALGDDAAIEALEDADQAVGRMTRLVDDLLLLARTDADAVELERRPIDLAEEAVDGFAPLAPLAESKGVELALDVEPTPMVGDPERLRRLAAILVDNAVRHAPPNGHVWVTVRPDGGRATLVVEDDGAGIPRDHRERVFERFWRAPDAPLGGSGLGLSIAAWIARAHGGSIAVGDRDAGGARFEVSLPA